MADDKSTKTFTQEQAERYSALLNAQIEEELADWPEAVRELDPGSSDLDARLAWMKKARRLADEHKRLPDAPPTGEASRPAPRFRFQNPGDVRW